MRQLLIEMAREESWIKVAGEARAGIRDSGMCPGRVRPSGGCYRYKPGKRPAICDELLKKPLALRIIAVTRHENYAVCYRAWLGLHADEIESSEHGFLGAVGKKNGAE